MLYKSTHNIRRSSYESELIKERRREGRRDRKRQKNNNLTNENLREYAK